MAASVRDAVMRHVLDEFRKPDAADRFGSGDLHPIGLVTLHCAETDADGTKALDAMQFASPAKTWIEFTEWCSDPARTFPEVLAMVEAADNAINGGPDHA